MNNELKKSWDELVIDAKGGCGALLEHNDATIIAADELIKEQQAEIEHYNNQLDRACGDGNTPADFDKLRDANLALAMESHQQQAHIERLRDFSNVAIKSIRTYGEHPLIEIMFNNVSAETPAQSLEAVNQGAQQ